MIILQKLKLRFLRIFVSKSLTCLLPTIASRVKMLLLIIFFKFAASDVKLAYNYKLSSNPLPEFTINLDTKPEDRWKEVAQEFGPKLKRYLPEIFEDAKERFGIDPVLIMQRFSDLASKLDAYQDLEQYLDEMRGFANHAQMTRAQVVFFNFYMECVMQSLDMWITDSELKTGVVSLTQSKLKNLRHLAIRVTFVEKKKQVMQGMTFSGMVGVTMASGIRVIISFNRLITENSISERLNQIINFKSKNTTWPVSFLLRNVLHKFNVHISENNTSEHTKIVDYLSNRYISIPCRISVYNIQGFENVYPGTFIFRNITLAPEMTSSIKEYAPRNLVGGSLHRPEKYTKLMLTNSYDFRQYEWNSQYYCSNTDGRRLWLAKWYADYYRFHKMYSENITAEETDVDDSLIDRMIRLGYDEKSIMRVLLFPSNKIFEVKHLYGEIPQVRRSLSDRVKSSTTLCYALCLLSYTAFIL